MMAFISELEWDQCQPQAHAQSCLIISKNKDTWFKMINISSWYLIFTYPLLSVPPIRSHLLWKILVLEAAPQKLAVEKQMYCNLLNQLKFPPMLKWLSPPLLLVGILCHLPPPWKIHKGLTMWKLKAIYQMQLTMSGSLGTPLPAQNIKVKLVPLPFWCSLEDLETFMLYFVLLFVCLNSIFWVFCKLHWSPEGSKVTYKHQKFQSTIHKSILLNDNILIRMTEAF